MIDRPFISQFSPQRTDPEALEQILVQRHDLLAESVARIRESVLTGNKHHLLFIGPRGAGKTHLVTLVQHRLRQQPDLADRMRMAWLNEDETATSFLKLLILFYRDLSQRYPQEFPASELQKIYGQKPDLAREQLGASLLQGLGQHTLVVVMENLDSLFKDMPVEEQRTWRAFVQNHPVFATVGTAQSLFAGVSKRTEPFFGFFDTRHLDTLSVDEAVTLLRNIAHLNGRTDLHEFLGTATGHARVQAIHDLAGGNPRLYIIFSDFLTRESLDDLVRPFEETADRQLTSYYQERLRWLSSQQREIVQHLCHQRHPIPVKQIAEGLFTTHNTITNQLKLLREMRYVRGHERGREVLYELAEPLMRLSLQVKETHNQQPLRLIVDFLRVWYDRTELCDRLDHLEASSRAREYFAAALALIDSGEPNLRHELLRRGLVDLNVMECSEAEFVRLRCLAEETRDSFDLRRFAAAMICRGAIAEADAALAAFVTRTDIREEDRLEAQKDLLALRDIAALGEGIVTYWDRQRDSDRCDSLIIEAIFEGSTLEPLWKPLIAAFLPHVADRQLLPILGEALVQHLPELAASPLNHTAYDAWADAWATSVAKLQPEAQAHFEIPMRLLRAGIAYYKTKDEGTLLSLASEERSILRKVLKLEPEPKL